MSTLQKAKSKAAAKPAGRIPKGETRGSKYRDAGRQRFSDAEILMNRHHFVGAIYLVGYAVECHLKFSICVKKGVEKLPADLEVHGWDTLAKEADLMDGLQQQQPMWAIYCNVVDRWSTSLRYATSVPQAPGKLYADLKELYQFLKDLVL